jgi:hypothetical protein
MNRSRKLLVGAVAALLGTALLTENPDGSYTLALFNLGSAAATVSATWGELGISGSASVRDLWAAKNLGLQASGFSATLASHASCLLRVVPTH